ncbi:hypothetical protein RI129_000202 [Pyrocoelia pectoralis]|uniref:Cell division cycle protein 16-like protein n=1 Tax=Pyrocoelia pectoralis TaxID=417401 RepID=A0AAN7USE7_9COLE
MKIVSVDNINVDNYRKLVHTYLNLHAYNTALFWADKVVALTSGNPRDIYWLAQCMFLLKQFHRAAHLLRSKNLDKSYILCNYLTVRCLFEANELNEALKVLNSMDLEVFLQTGNTSCNVSIDAGMFDDTPKYQVQSSVLLLKGKVLEAMDNRGLASECYKQALQCDVYCFEAFDSLICHHMLSAAEEQELLNSLPIAQQCTTAEAEVLRTLYKSKLKKYNTIVGVIPTKTCKPIYHNTPLQTSLIVLHKKFVNIAETPKASTTSCTPTSEVGMDKTEDSKAEHMVLDSLENSIQIRLQQSLDLAVSQAELFYYNCDYVQCSKLTENILKEDPYHAACLPIHISCMVELKQSNKLFTLAHNLVDLYPNLAISWFAVGCYYYVIGTIWTLVAVENEHDQAMAAYFKMSLTFVYIGLECGLTNNVRLAERFFQQAQIIAPDDPFVMHEMGVIAFQNLDFETAEKHFQDALIRVKPIKDSIVPERWEPLLNNLGHTCRKLKKYCEALEYHHQALVLCPQSASTYSAIAYVHSLVNNIEDAVHWFHKALGLRRDDTFSTTMLNYVIEQLSMEQLPYPDAPDFIPDYDIGTNVEEDTTTNDNAGNSSERQITASDMSIEVDL